MASGSQRATKGLFSFFRLCGELKHLKRTGWVNRSVQDPETVAGHMYRMAMMAMLLGSEEQVDREKYGVSLSQLHDKKPFRVVKFTYSQDLNASFVVCPLETQKERGINRCIRMALVHDLAESLVGDITPHDGVSKEDKYTRELKGMRHIQELIPENVGAEIYELWKEYEDGKTPEALLVKDLDKFDMIFQAFEYETSQNRTGELQEFFSSTSGKFCHPEVKLWVDQLIQERKGQSSSVNSSPSTNRANE